MARRDIPHYHEVLPSVERPTVGKIYRWYLGDRYVYTARVLEFGGGCWARVQILEPAPEHRSLYPVGAVLDIKVAHYRIEQLPPYESTLPAPS